MILNLFYLSLTKRKTLSIELKSNENIDDLYQIISLKESIPENEFKLYSNGKRLETTKHLTNDSVIGLHFGINGGKGGFGSMLRAIGAQIEKTTNREACRDLTGRRLRDINEEKRIKEWIKKEKSRKDEMEERKRQKLEKLAQKPKTEFNDLEFERNRSEIPDIVDQALQYGLQLQLKGQQSTSSPKRKQHQQKVGQTKRKKTSTLWIGDDIDEEDDSSDDNPDQIVDNTEDPNTKDSLISNDSTNDSEVTNDSKNILTEKQESNEPIVQQMDKTGETEITLVGSQPSKSDPIDAQQTAQGSITVNKNTEQVFQPLNLIDFKSIEQLESLGLDRLKHSLMALGLKCGGTLNERANRLWSIRGLDIKDIPKKLFAKKK